MERWNSISVKTPMEPHRPRPSILSLFDPLSNKENDFVGETSFFHSSDTRNEPQQRVHIPRHRLIDVGDMTLDAPDMHDLFIDQDDLEHEINQSVAEEEDDNETLTFKDMAKAATPKWSGRHVTSFTTPKSSPTPRTPLVEIHPKDEATPMARKKPFRRPIQVESKNSGVDATLAVTHQPNSPEPPEISESTAIRNISTPIIEISTDETTPEGKSSMEGLGSSVCTLNLPTPSDALIADTSIPHLVSPPSPHASTNTLLPPPTHTRLRPTSNSRASPSSRYSVDLQSSFQLHLSSSESTFDLLNEKISFFSSKDDNDSFLNNLENDDSFGDADFVPTKPTEKRVISRKASPTQEALLEVQENAPEDFPTDHLNMQRAHGVIQHAPQPTIHSTENVPLSSVTNGALDSGQGGSRFPGHGARVVQSIPSAEVKEPNILSTPNSSSSLQPPLPPVPALRIVKRSRLIPRMSTSTTGGHNSRRTSSVPAVPTAIIPISRSTMRQSPPELGSRLIGKKSLDVPKEAKGTDPMSSFSNAPVPGNGPRRVLMPEGPKSSSISNTRAVDQARSFSTVSGPRRVAVAKPTNSVVERAPRSTKPVVPATSGLKQPGRYATVGATSIPKPVSREAGSRLPGPQGGKQRLGVVPGLQGLARRFT